MTYPIVSDNPEIQADYERMRADGQTHLAAEMYALRAGPTIHGTDSNFMRGASGGRKYISQLGKKSDPKAWVSSADDLRAVCKAKGWGCDGLVKVDAPPIEDRGPEPYRVADDIVDKAVAERAKEDPGLLQRRRLDDVKAETREMVSPEPGGM